FQNIAERPMLDVPSPANDMPCPEADCSRTAMPPAFADCMPSASAASAAPAIKTLWNPRLSISFPQARVGAFLCVGIVPAFSPAAIDLPPRKEVPTIQEYVRIFSLAAK